MTISAEATSAGPAQRNGQPGPNGAGNNAGGAVPFTRIPNHVLLDARLSFGARVLFGLLAYHARAKGFCFPGEGILGKELGADIRTVRRYLCELTKADLVAIEHRGHGKTNRYTLLDDRTNLSGQEAHDRTNLSGLDRTNLSGQEAHDRTNLSGPLREEEEDVLKNNNSNKNVAAVAREKNLQALMEAGLPERLSEKFIRDKPPELIVESLAFLNEKRATSKKPIANPAGFLRSVLEGPEAFGFTKNGRGWERPKTMKRDQGPTAEERRAEIIRRRQADARERAEAQASFARGK